MRIFFPLAVIANVPSCAVYFRFDVELREVLALDNLFSRYFLFLSLFFAHTLSTFSPFYLSSLGNGHHTALTIPGSHDFRKWLYIEGEGEGGGGLKKRKTRIKGKEPEILVVIRKQIRFDCTLNKSKIFYDMNLLNKRSSFQHILQTFLDIRFCCAVRENIRV